MFHLAPVQDNTIADSPMVELLTGMQHMLEQARVRSMGLSTTGDLQQLVIIVADGRFHEKESLQRVVAVRMLRPHVALYHCMCNHPASG